MTIEVTCQTEGCENQGVTIAMPLGPAVHCGPCGALLADADPAYTPPAAAIPDDIAQLAERVAALEQQVGSPIGGTATPGGVADPMLAETGEALRPQAQTTLPDPRLEVS